MEGNVIAFTEMGAFIGAGLTETEEEASEGMPQLDPSSFDNQIFWLVLALIAIYLIVTRVAVPRIGTILASRAGTIAGDLQTAERLRGEAREAEAAYDRALAEARAEAGRIAAAARAEIQAGLDAELATADARIAAKTAESQQALAAIEREADASVALVARDVAREIVAVMGGAPDAAVDATVGDIMARGRRLA
jgi:F-type H+-transporting ATPase subunit b